MSDLAGFDERARRLTKQLRASAEHVPARRPLLDSSGLGADRPSHHLLLEGVLAGVLAVAVVAVVFALPRHAAHAPNTARPTLPVTSSTPTPSTTPETSVPEVVSTIRVGPPLILSSAGGSSSALTAWDASGDRVGTLEVNAADADNGCAISPDGSKVFIGDGKIFTIAGTQLGDVRSFNMGGPGAAGCGQPGIAGAYFLGGPIWADDSDHVCGFTGTPEEPGQGTALLEVGVDGRSRTVADVTGSGQVLACSPEADRVVVLQSAGNGPSNDHSTILVMSLSSGAVETRLSAAGIIGTATHDGRLVAMNGPTGITVYDTVTGRQVAHIVRHGDEGSAGGVPDLGAADLFSWDGSRLLVVADSANGAFHPAWIVSLATGSNLLTDVASKGSPYLNFIDGSVVPLATGDVFFLGARDVEDSTSESVYFIDEAGHLQALH
jgi:hypothetical protein